LSSLVTERQRAPPSSEAPDRTMPFAPLQLWVGAPELPCCTSMRPWCQVSVPDQEYTERSVSRQMRRRGGEQLLQQLEPEVVVPESGLGLKSAEWPLSGQRQFVGCRVLPS